MQKIQCPYRRYKFELTDANNEKQIVSTVRVTLEDAETYVELLYPNHKYELDEVFEVGNNLDDLEEGDMVTYRSYGNSYKVAYVEKNYKKHVTLRELEYKFRKRDGRSTTAPNFVWISRYDEEWFVKRELEREWKRQIGEVERVKWSTVNQNTFNEIYAILKQKGILGK